MKKSVVLLALLCATSMVSGQNQISIDTSKSLVKWTGSNLFKFNKHFGTVKFRNGVFLKRGGSIFGGKFEMDMTSIINTDGKYNEMLVWHLKNEDFFDVEKYPTSKLEILNVRYNDHTNVEIEANLTIKNTTQPIAFGATLENVNDKLVLKSKFIIDRTRWAITYESKSLLNSLKDDIISDAIEFEVIVYTK